MCISHQHNSQFQTPDLIRNLLLQRRKKYFFSPTPARVQNKNTIAQCSIYSLCAPDSGSVYVLSHSARVDRTPWRMAFRSVYLSLLLLLNRYICMPVRSLLCWTNDGKKTWRLLCWSLLPVLHLPLPLWVFVSTTSARAVSYSGLVFPVFSAGGSFHFFIANVTVEILLKIFLSNIVLFEEDFFLTQIIQRVDRICCAHTQRGKVGAHELWHVMREQGAVTARRLNLLHELDSTIRD